jgi:hypothetical protein
MRPPRFLEVNGKWILQPPLMEWQQLGDRHRSALQRRQRALPG